MILTKKALIGVLLGVPLSAVLTFGVWALDTRYVTIASLEEYSQMQRKNELGERVDELTLKKTLGLATEFDKALLDQLKEKIQRID
jgi:hypothetical protein